MRSPAKAPMLYRLQLYSYSELRLSQRQSTSSLPREPYSKRGSGLNRCPFVEFSVCRFLEPLHQLDVPEPAKVVVKTARIVVGVTVECAKRLRRIRAQDVVATHSKGRVVQQRLPAGHD